MNEECRCARGKPMVVKHLVGKGFDQTEGIIDVFRFCREMVAVIACLDFLEHLIPSQSLNICKFLDVGLEHRLDFLLRDSTDGGKLRQERNVVQVVDGGEDAQLRKLRNARDEAETDHRLTRLQRLIELLHHFAELGQVFVLMKHLEQRGVVLIDDQHHLPARLLVGTANQTLKEYSRQQLIIISAVQFDVWFQNRK